MADVVECAAQNFTAPSIFGSGPGLGGIATRARHGKEFFREIRKLRMYYLKGYVTRKTKQKMHQMIVDMYKAESNPFARRAMQLYLQSQNGEL
jgi:hypothetical protein